MSGADHLFAEPRTMIVDFAFDEQVAAVFPDMIRRSLPGYGEIIALIGLFAERYAQPDSRLYDLGCSLGAATLSMRRRVRGAGCRIVAVDAAEAMVQRCRLAVAAYRCATPVEVICADLREVEIERASVVVLNFTLQFVPPAQRLALLRRIHEGMLPGGLLLLSEKVVFGPDEQAFQERMHLDFKRANGYSELEISQKRAALERVLQPESIDTHRERLAAAGFGTVHTWFQCFNFVSLAAFKGDAG